MEKIGFIGCGNMGGALAKAACKSGAPGNVVLANRTLAKAEALAGELGCAVGSNQSIAQNCEWIFLGVKPQMMADMLAGIAPVLKARQGGFVLVSMAAGLSCQSIADMAGGDYPVIRIMPNTPAAIGQGVVQVCGRGVSRAQLDACKAILAPAGLGGEQALRYAAQMVAGSAEMVLQSGRHPGQLKDAVGSPGGTTIQGVRALEANGFRSAAMEAVLAAYEKTLKLGK